VRFSVRVATARHGGPPAAGSAASNPFLPYDENLFVCDLPPRHVCLLNKYPVLPEHLLVVTRAYEDQESPLAPGDFEALWSVLCERDGLAFYNAGAAAGASQPHRHLQIVPPSLGHAGTRTPIDPVLDDARFDAAVGRVERLPFHHGVARLRDCAPLPPPLAAEALYGLYLELARAFGCDRAGRPYNLLVTRDWMLFVPRSREHWDSVSLNALAFAGAILVHHEAQLDRLRAVGPMSALARVGVRV
jgi:ATP adenylyltransferase